MTTSTREINHDIRGLKTWIFAWFVFFRQLLRLITVILTPPAPPRVFPDMTEYSEHVKTGPIADTHLTQTRTDRLINLFNIELSLLFQALVI